MDDIEEFIKIDTQIEKGMVIITFTTLDSTITTLRILKFLKKLKLLFEDLKDDRIKKFSMIFNVNTITIIPKEHIIDVINIMKQYRPLLEEKTKCSCIVVNSIIKVAFEMLLNKFYEPIKPIFICKDIEECMKYTLMDESEEEYNKLRFTKK